MITTQVNVGVAKQGKGTDVLIHVVNSYRGSRRIAPFILNLCLSGR
jgi:hypothetical protein